MKPIRRKDLLFLLFPKLRLVKFSFDSLKCLYGCCQKRKEFNKKKMRLPIKIAIGCTIGAVVIIIFGFIAFPKMIKGKVKKVSGCGGMVLLRHCICNAHAPVFDLENYAKK